MTLNQFLYKHDLHIVIHPKDGSNYVCANLCANDDVLGGLENSITRVFGKHEEVWEKLTQIISNTTISWGHCVLHHVKVPELCS